VLKYNICVLTTVPSLINIFVLVLFTFFEVIFFKKHNYSNLNV